MGKRGQGTGNTGNGNYETKIYSNDTDTGTDDAFDNLTWKILNFVQFLQGAMDVFAFVFFHSIKLSWEDLDWSWAIVSVKYWNI